LVESDRRFAKAGGSIKETIKRYFINGAKGYFSSSQMINTFWNMVQKQIEIPYIYCLRNEMFSSFSRLINY